MAGDLLAAHRGGDGQEAEAWEALNVALHMIGIANLDAHELVAATDAEHRSTVAMSLDDGLGATVAAQFHEVVERRLRAGQDDDVRPTDVVDVAGIEEIHTRVTLQRVEVGEVANMT